jgi:hypothetical protein
MLIKSRFSGWLPDGTRTPFMGGGNSGGGGGTTQSTGTTYNTNIPEYARPYVENMLGATQKQLFDMDDTGQITGFKPYQPYSTDPSKYVAGFQPLQEDAMRTVGQMQVPGQFNQATNLAGMGGLGSFNAAQQAMGAGQQFAQQAQDPRAMQGYMSPYMQNVVDYQKSQAVRDYQIAQPMRKAQAVGQGAFGGSRQAIQESEAERALGSQLQGITATGSQKAFEDAQRQQQFGANLNLQGLQTGLQGYGQMGQAASTLGSLGSQQFGMEKDIVGLKSQYGKEQQALEQQKINQAIQDWANTQQYPLMQLGVMSNMLRGLPMQSATTNQYVASPNALTQGIGLAGAGASIFNALKREGGVIKEKKMASGGITSIPRYDVGGSVRAKLEMMPLEKLQSYKSESPAIQEMVEEILRDKTGKAGGGIIAFKNRGEVEDKEDPDAVAKAYRDAAIMNSFKQELKPYVERPPVQAAPAPVPTPPVERADPAAVAAAYRDAEALRPPVAPPPVKPPSGIQALNEAIINRASSLPKDFPAELSYEFDKNRSDLRQKAIEQGARIKTRETAASEAPSKIEAPKEAGIKAASKPETKSEAKPEAKPEGKANIKTAPVAATTPAAGIKDVPGLQMPVAPVDPDAGKTIAQIAAEKAAYMGPNAGAQETMAKLMAERANAADEARRTSALRMAEFFGAWGSTPGNTIVAGLNTLKTKVPDIIGDMKEATKIRRQIDKDISEIEKIERLEKSGNYDEAAKRKSELGKNAMQKYGYDVKAYSDAQQTSAYLKAAEIKGPSGSGAGGEGKAGTLYNQAVIRYQTEEKNIIAAKEKDKEYRRALIKLRTDPTNAEALAIKNGKEAGWNAKLKERKDDVEYYKNKQGREARVSGDSGETKTTGAPGTASNPIVLK